MSSSSSDSVDLSRFLNSTEIFTIEKINGEIIPALIDQISKAQKAIPLPKSENNNNEITNFTVITTTTTTTTTIGEITTTDDKVVDNGISTTTAAADTVAATTTTTSIGEISEITTTDDKVVDNGISTTTAADATVAATTTTTTIGEISEITTTDDKVVDNGISTTTAADATVAATTTITTIGEISEITTTDDKVVVNGISTTTAAADTVAATTTTTTIGEISEITTTDDKVVVNGISTTTAADATVAATTTTTTIGEISEITTTDDKVVVNGISTTTAADATVAATTTTATRDNNDSNGIQQGTSKNNTTTGHSRVGFLGIIRWFKSATTTTTTTIKKKKSSKDSGGKSLSLHQQHQHLHGQLEKLRIDLNNVKASFEEISKFEQTINNPFKQVLHDVDAIVKEVTKTPQASLGTNGAVQTKIRDLNKIVTTLKLHVPSAHKISSVNSETHRLKRSVSDPTSNEGSAHNLFDVLPNLSKNEHFRRSYEFSDIKEVYNRLDVKMKLCLLCFSAFPEGAVVQRRILLYWWIGEGLIVPPKTAGKTVEDLADDILKELVMKRFIEPVNKKQRLVADHFKMHSFIRSMVITLAKEAEFFDFDDKGNPTTNFPSSHRACLIKEGSSFGLSNNPSDQSNQEDLYTLFNVSEQYLKLVPDWLLKMKNANVLQLGRWQSSAKHHIEVEDTDFLKRLKNMKLLKFFSLQGISRIMELPNTIGKLTNLRIMDLRACHNLEVLPEDIGLLKNLTHLDMSECYLLDTMPKGISLLTKLQVLKGFVIGDPKSGSPCTLADLVSLNKLRKLTISTGWKDFPSEKELTALKQFKALRKLKIAWGGRSLEKPVATNTTNQDNRGNDTKRDNRSAVLPTSAPPKSLYRRTITRLSSTLRGGPTDFEILALPNTLEKVDLQCFPHTKRPKWLDPRQLTNLKKLYIRGGTLGNLCRKDINEVWTVEILRVKYLYELKMDWRELQTSFPNLKYLEKVKCPKLTFCPCNERGVWLNLK